jgi:AcrR family transcriptional regulator
MQHKSTGVYMTRSATPSRTRNAALTREAILQSALAAFSRHGYDGIGVREIARAAGVTAVLVNRYFGSKEKLFSAAVEVAFSDSTLFQGDVSSLAHRLTQMVIAKTDKDADPIDPLLLLLRSAPNPQAAKILRASIARHFERPLQYLLTRPRARARAAMILAVISGLQLFRKVIASKALTQGSPSALHADIESTFQHLISGR